MAITNTAQNDFLIDSFAVSQTLTATQGGNNEIVFDNDVTNATGAGGNTNDSSYVGRLIILRRGQADEEIRRGISESGAGPVTVVVDRDWDSNPVANTDTADVCYEITDITAVVGTQPNSKSGAYELPRDLFVGNGTDAAGFAVTDAGYLEMNDAASQLGFTVRNNGDFYIGYSVDGSSQDGGILTTVEATNGDPFGTVLSGGRMEVYDSIFWSQRATTDIQIDSGSETIIKNTKFINATQELDLRGEVSAVSVAGTDSSLENIRVYTSAEIDGITIANTNGFASGNEVATETFTIKDAVFISNLNLVSVEATKTWQFIDPTWDATAIGDFNWVGTTTDSYVRDKRSIDLFIQNQDGVGQNNGVFAFYSVSSAVESLTAIYSSNNPSGTAGSVTGDYVYKEYRDGNGTPLTITFGSAAQRADVYGFTPFASAHTITDKLDGTRSLGSDTQLSASTAAIAVGSLANTPVTINRDLTSPAVVVDFTGSNLGTLTAGDTIADDPTTPTFEGTLLQLTSNDVAQIDGTGGSLLIDVTTGTVPPNGSTLYNNTTSVWQATFTNDSSIQYSVYINANTNKLGQIYDYLAGKSASVPLDASGETIHKWGKGSQSRMLYKSGAAGNKSYNTLRSGNTEGVILYNYSLDSGDTVASFVGDDNSSFTPAATRFVIIRDIKDGTEVRIHRVDTGEELGGVEDITGGVGTGNSSNVTISGTTDDNVFTFSYTFNGTSVSIYAVLISLEYEYLRIGLELDSDGADQAVDQRIDRNYFNPS